MKLKIVVLLCCGWINSVFALGDTTNEFPQKVGQGGTAVANTSSGNVTVNNNYRISEEVFAKYAADLGVTDAALANFFKILKQNNVDRLDLDNKLREIAESYKKLSENAKLLENSDDPKVKELLQQAREFIDGKDAQGNAIPIDFSKADALLQQAIKQVQQNGSQLREKAEEFKIAIEKNQLVEARILAQQGDSAKTQLKYAEAANCYQQAAERLPAGYEKDKGDYLNNAGLAFRHAGKYQQAFPLYQNALEIREKVLSKQHEDYAESLNNLADLHQEQGQYEQALPLYQEALKIYEQGLNKQNPYYAKSLNNLALLYKSQGQYEQAFPLYQEALKIREQVRGKQHEDYAESLNDLALFYHAQGKYEQALPLYQEALRIYEHASGIGKRHPDYVTNLNNLANLYSDQEQYEQALPLLKDALTIREQVLGKQHPYYAVSLNSLAELYRKQGWREQALPLYQEALKICKHLGNQHKDYAIRLHNLAYFYSSQGEYEKALPLFQQAVEIQTKLSGEKNPHSRIFAKNLRRVQNYLDGKYQVVVEQITPGSSASLLGIEIGDIFTHYNQQSILGKSQFTEKFAKEFADTIGEFKLLRDGKMLTFQLKPNEIEVELEEKLKSEP